MRKQKAETPIVKAAMEWAAAKFTRADEGKIWRANSGGNKSGRKHNSINLPDIVGWDREARAVVVEVKTAVGRLTDDQARFLSSTSYAGGNAYLYAADGVWEWGHIPAHHMPAKKRNKGKQ